MRQGTAPIHTFTLPFEAAELKTVQITYSQRGKIVLQKHTEDCTFEGKTISVQLTQAETLNFCADYMIAVQLRGLLTDGTPVASDIKLIRNDPSLDKEVLT